MILEQTETADIDRGGTLVEAARRAGADFADAAIIRSASKSVTVRLGSVEGTDASESEDVTLRVFVGDRVASVSAASAYDADALAERAVAMAKASPPDPKRTLASADLLARDIADLDLIDGTELSAAELTETALAMEETGRAVPGITNSMGAGASTGFGRATLVTSHSFSGSYGRSRFGRSVQLVGGEGTAMERDYDFSSAVHFEELRDAETLGRAAADRVLERLGSRKAPTGRVPVIFDPRVARGLAGTLGAAINGASVVRKTSFLRDRMDQRVASAGITLTDDPLKRRGSGSRPFDGEGVRGEKLTMIDDGVLRHWFLATTAANELGLVTNGRGARSGAQVGPSSTNLAIEAGPDSPEALIGALDRAFYVTEVIGQGVNMVTGDYSRGASGFWIEKGERAYPVSEVTIAGNLKDMFLSMTPANDLDRSFATAAPTLLIEGMILAGT